MSKELSVSELAVAVAPVVSHPREPSEGHVDVVLRRLRSWTVAGAISAIGSTHTGSGKHRRYAADTAYVAAALNVLAENDQGIGMLVNAGRYLHNLCGPNPLVAGAAVNHWNHAIAGSYEVFLVVGAWVRLEGFAARSKAQGVIAQDDVLNTIAKLPGGVFVNLTSTFKLIQP